jgi:hypothetical protein
LCEPPILPNLPTFKCLKTGETGGETRINAYAHDYRWWSMYLMA